MKRTLSSADPEVVAEQDTRSTRRWRELVQRRPELQRASIDILQGTVHNVELSRDGRTATFDLGERQLDLTVPSDRISIAEGDEVLLAGRAAEPFRAGLYFNETTEQGSLEAAHRLGRNSGIAGAVVGVAGVAVFATVLRAAHGDTLHLGRVLIYAASGLVGAALLYTSISLLIISSLSRRMLKLFAAVVNAA